MTREISPERKTAYYVGMGLSGVGILLFVLPFITIPLTMMGRGSFTAVPTAFVFAFIGFGLNILGQFLMRVGKVGLAGAGVILDPERARQEHEPLSRMSGGMIRDGLDEAGLLDESGLKFGRNAKTEPVVMIRCRECGKLNEEDSKFCQECGEKI